MPIPKILLFDDYLGLTDLDGQQIEKEDILKVKNKLEELLMTKEGYLQKEGYVYFVKDINGLIKIGCTSNFKHRFSSLKIKNPNIKLVRLLKCESMIDLERYFHIIFKKERITGEWFSLEEEIVLSYKLGETEKYFGAVDVE